jgi:hypothetical protein
MKNLILISLIISTLSYGKCDLSTDVKKTPNGNYIYSKECHLLMGQWKNDLEKRQKQVKALEKTITLKDLAINTNLQRVDRWRDTSFTLEDRLFKIERLQSTNKVLYFGIGVIFTGLSVWAASQINQR